MDVIVFVTDDGSGPAGSAPLLVLPDDPSQAMPSHPKGMGWRYFATTTLDDGMFSSERQAIADAFQAGEVYISPTLIAR